MAVKPGSASGAGLAGYLDGLMAKLLDLLGPAFVEGREDAIHQARVATRRLTAALRLFEPILTPKPSDAVRRTLRKLRRRLGALRDLDVMGGHLRELGVGRKKFGPAAQWVGARLRAQRTEIAGETARDTDVKDAADRLSEWPVVREEIGRRRDEEQCLLRASLAAQVQDFGGRAAAARRGDPHELRIAGKQLRYTFEMAKEAGLNVPEHVPAAFKAMQEALGLWHDYVVLATRVMEEALEAELAVHDPVKFRQALDLTREVARRAALKLGAFHRLWKNAGGVMRRAVEALARDRSRPAEAAAREPAG